MEGDKPPAYQDVPATAYPPQTSYPPPTCYPPPPAATYEPQPQPATGYPQPATVYPQPMQPGYPPHNTTTVITGQPMVTVIAPTSFNLRDRPMNVVCPNCHNNVVTACDYESGNLTWLIAIIICLLFWPCAWLPFVFDQWKDVSHRCPACNFMIGYFRRM